MPIHTERPAKLTYVRILRDTEFVGNSGMVIPKGSVGKLTAVAPADHIVIVDVSGYGQGIFDKDQVKEITEKEYFIGALRGAEN